MGSKTTFHSFQHSGYRRARGSNVENKILDPQGPFIRRWNKTNLLSCVVALALDLMFFYIPVIDGKNKCLSVDKSLKFAVCIARSLVDISYLLHIIIRFVRRTYSQIPERGDIMDTPWPFGMRYLSFYAVIDILSILPVPQLVLLVIPSARVRVPLVTKNSLKYVIFLQFIPRLVRIYPLYKEVILTETAWGVFNLLLYLLASHVIGATWYLFPIEQQERCWIEECHKGHLYNVARLYCSAGRDDISYKFLVGLCRHVQPDNPDDVNFFDFGIYLDALKSRVVESTAFRRKFFYCFLWGLRGISSLGQNLQPSTSTGEMIFVVLISISGLVLFSLFIGNMQKYLQFTTAKMEEMKNLRERLKQYEQWMSHRMLPEELRVRIRRYEQFKWKETKGVEEEHLISNLPKDIRMDIKRHLGWGFLMRVPIFERIREELLVAMCDRLKQVLFTEKSFIIREGDPVDAMLFIVRGNLESIATNGVRELDFNRFILLAGDFCGEELLTWAMDPHASVDLPTSTRTVRSMTEVEAFALTAEDLKFVASRFGRLDSQQLQHTFRFYSLQWRRWAACFIQVAWRRYLRRKMEKSFREAEARLLPALSNTAGTSISLGAAIFAARFASNLLRLARQNGLRSNRFSLTVPPIPPRPEEPDFSDRH